MPVRKACGGGSKGHGEESPCRSQMHKGNRIIDPSLYFEIIFGTQMERPSGKKLASLSNSKLLECGQ